MSPQHWELYANSLMNASQGLHKRTFCIVYVSFALFPVWADRDRTVLRHTTEIHCTSGADHSNKQRVVYFSYYGSSGLRGATTQLCHHYGPGPTCARVVWFRKRLLDKVFLPVAHFHPFHQLPSATSKRSNCLAFSKVFYSILHLLTMALYRK